MILSNFAGILQKDLKIKYHFSYGQIVCKSRSKSINSLVLNPPGCQ